MSAGYSLTIQRASAYDSSYDVYAKRGSVPIESGDGLFMGNFTILPYETEIIASAIVPASGLWGFLVCAISSREITAVTRVDPT
jgi:hypothetical protein